MEEIKDATKTEISQLKREVDSLDDFEHLGHDSSPLNEAKGTAGDFLGLKNVESAPAHELRDEINKRVEAVGSTVTDSFDPFKSDLLDKPLVPETMDSNILQMGDSFPDRKEADAKLEKFLHDFPSAPQSHNPADKYNINSFMESERGFIQEAPKTHFTNDVLDRYSDSEPEDDFKPSKYEDFSKKQELPESFGSTENFRGETFKDVDDLQPGLPKKDYPTLQASPEPPKPVEKLPEPPKPAEKLPELPKPVEQHAEPPKQVEKFPEPSEKLPEPIKPIEKLPEPAEKLPEPVKPKTPEPDKEKTPEPVIKPEPVKEKTPEPVEKVPEIAPSRRLPEPVKTLPEQTKIIEKIIAETKPKIAPADAEAIFCKMGLDAWFNPERLNPRVESLIYWRDPKKSGPVFGGVLLVLLALTYFSFISVAAYASLFVLSGTIAFRIYRNIVQAVQKTGDGHPFKEQLELDVSLSPDKVRELSEVAVAHLNAAVVELRRLFLVEDLVDSIKFGVLLWTLTYLGAWFNGMTLIIIAWVALFTLPKVYETNKTQIDANLEIVRTKLAEITSKVKAAIPIGKKAEEKKEQ